MQADEERKAHLVAAAQALAGWMHERRGSWDAELDDLGGQARTSGLAGSLAAIPFDSALDSLPGDASRFEEELAPTEAPKGPGVAARAFRSLGTLAGAALRGLAARARTSRRLAPYGVALAVATGGIWLARPYVAGAGAYWAQAKAWVSSFKLEMEPTREQTVVTAPPTKGQLIVQSEPRGARVSLDGIFAGMTPLTLDQVSFGRHTVEIETSQGYVRRTVDVTPNRPVLVNESIFPGFLKVFAPFEIEISDGKRAILLDDQSQALVQPGRYELRFENRALGYLETQRVEVRPGETTTLSLVPPPSTLTLTSTEPAAVLIDGEPAGETPLTDRPVALGTRITVVRNGAGIERSFTQLVTVAPVRIEVDFSN